MCFGFTRLGEQELQVDIKYFAMGDAGLSLIFSAMDPKLERKFQHSFS
jgi:hypothetical protein